MTDAHSGYVATGGLAVGLDIGGTKVQGVLLAPDGTALGEAMMPTVHGPRGVLRSAGELTGILLAGAGHRIEDVATVGVGVPGLVSPESGTVKHAVNLGIDGDGFDLAGALSAHLGGVPVSVDNDLNVAAVGAAHAVGGAAPDLAFLALGTGVAAGIVLGGELRRGVSGAAGEVGHLPIDPLGRLCACGQRGCIETYASGSALDLLWPSRRGLPAPVELFDAADAGDAKAVAVRGDLVRAVASAVRILVLTIDVGHVVVGGGVSRLGERLLREVRLALAEQATGVPFLTSLGLADRVTVAPSTTPIAAVGAALVGRRKVVSWK